VNAEVDQIDDGLEPGALESFDDHPAEPKQLDDEEYGAKVRKRINKEVYKTKKAREDLEHEQGENVKLRQELDELRTKRYEEREDSLKAREEEAAKRAKAAFDAGETDDYMKANDELLDAKVERRTMGDKPTPKPKDALDDPKPMAEAAVNWVGRNQEWIKNDPERFQRAQEIESDLRKKGYRPSDPELYKEVDKRLNGKPEGESTDVIDDDDDPRMEGDSRYNVPDRGESGGEGRRNKAVLTDEDKVLMDRYGFDKDNVEHRKQWLKSKGEV